MALPSITEAVAYLSGAARKDSSAANESDDTSEYVTPQNPTVRKDNGAASESDDTTESWRPAYCTATTNVDEIAVYADSELSDKLMSIQDGDDRATLNLDLSPIKVFVARKRKAESQDEQLRSTPSKILADGRVVEKTAARGSRSYEGRSHSRTSRHLEELVAADDTIKITTRAT